ncbi:MAG: hypothetical protein CMJ75_07275 [Planctomycetaceae bacterium]|nr:hypothetical protein [Planctomycetaceae bacterium]
MPLILEGIVTTTNADGQPNISPMGPIVAPDLRTLLLRPYQTSRTFQNLKRTGVGIFHVVDNVSLLARAAVGKLDPLPALSPCLEIPGYILNDACRWYAFRVCSLADAEPRTRLECEVLSQGHLRDFFGLNRAKHAVVEAAILVTRMAWSSRAELETEFARLATLVEKTGGEQEHQAFDFLFNYLRQSPNTCFADS